MKRALAPALLFTALAPGLMNVAQAQEPAALVRGFFAALERKDYPRALALTQGAAQKSTADFLGSLEQRAAQQHAQIELKVQDLQLKPKGEDHVEASFHIDVIGKKWMFKKVARKLDGTAEFKVASNGEHIEDIDCAFQ
jgi:hypothetical protein